MSRDGIINAAGNVFIAEAAMVMLGSLNPRNKKQRDAVAAMMEKLRLIRNSESLIADTEPST